MLWQEILQVGKDVNSSSIESSENNYHICLCLHSQALTSLLAMPKHQGTNVSKKNCVALIYILQ